MSLRPLAVPPTTRIGPNLVVEQRYSGAVRVPDPEIVCVDCGGTCYPLGWQPSDGEVPDGTVIPYRCRDCHDRWDVVISSDDEV